MVFISTDRGCGPEGGGYVYAFHKATGKLKWKLKASGPSTGFAQISDLIVFGTRTDEWLAAAIRSGQVKWSNRDPGTDPGCQIRSSPVTDGKRIYLVTHDSVIYALNSSGRRLWFRRAPTPVSTSLFIHKNVLYFGAESGFIYAINLANDSFSGKLQIPGIPRGRFAGSGNGGADSEYLFAVENKEGRDIGVLHSFSDEFGRVLWSSSAEREWTSEQPHLWREWIIAGNCKGDVVAYRVADGKPAWSDHVKGCVRSFGHDDLTLYIGVQEGTVYAYRPATP